jgi:hypothetical protein
MVSNHISSYCIPYAKWFDDVSPKLCWQLLSSIPTPLF